MLIAATLAFTIVTQSRQTSVTSLANFDLPAFNQFFEHLVNEEAVLHIDRQEVTRTKASQSSLKSMMDHAVEIKGLVQAYQDNTLLALSDDAPKQIVALNSSLEKLKEGLDGAKLLARFVKKREKKNVDMSAPYCCDHDAAYLGVLLAAAKIPKFSFANLAPPARYNIAPVLYDRQDGIFFADPADPTVAKVLARPDLRGKGLWKGDVIVAVQGEDKKWEPVANWGDILAASKDFEMDENGVHLRVRRKDKIREIRVTDVPSSIDDE